MAEVTVKQPLPSKLCDAVIDAVQSLFEVLKKKHPSITGDGVIDCIKQYGDIYKGRDGRAEDLEPISHNKPEYQLAYLVRYFYPHIAVTMYVLTSIADYLKNAFVLNSRDENTRVCCLGGGPLPEIFALWLYMEASEDLKRKSVSVFSLDLHATAWKVCFDAVADELTKKKIITMAASQITPVSCDLSNLQAVQENLGYIQNSSIVFALKVLSDIWILNPSEVKKCIELILRNMSFGALFIYVDNCGSGTSIKQLNEICDRAPDLKKLMDRNITVKPDPTLPHFNLDRRKVEARGQDKSIIVRIYQKEPKNGSPESVPVQLSDRFRKRSLRSQNSPSDTEDDYHRKNKHDDPLLGKKLCYEKRLK